MDQVQQIFYHRNYTEQEMRSVTHTELSRIFHAYLESEMTAVLEVNGKIFFFLISVFFSIFE